MEVTVDLINDTDGCFEKIQNKTLRGFSIGWICNDCVFREEGTKFIREVISLDLVEISVVATPANPNTLFTLAKSLKKLFDKMGLEKKDSEEIIETAPEVTVETQEPEAQESETPEKKSEDTGEEVPPETVDTVEAPAVADATPEVVDPDKSDIVQADEIPAVVTGETTVDEVEALIEPMIADAVEKAVSHLIAQNVELKTALEALQVKITAVESDVCKIEVQPSRRSESKSVSRVLTYSML